MEPKSRDLWSSDWFEAVRAVGVLLTWALCISFAVSSLFMFFNGAASLALFLALFALLFKPKGG